MRNRISRLMENVLIHKYSSFASKHKESRSVGAERMMGALPLISPQTQSRRHLHQSRPSTVATRCFCNFSTLFLVVTLLFLILIILSAVAYQRQCGRMISFTTSKYHQCCFHPQSSAKKKDDAQQQTSFLTNENSSIARVYHGEKFPALNGTTKLLNAIPLSAFCSKIESGTPKYAVFKDVILAERKLYLPSTINCSLLPREHSISPATRFNRGQGSSPQLEVMVVPNTNTFEDFQPHLSCHERVYEPSVLLSFINWPQYGHAMFNGISLLWEIFDGPLSNAGKNVRLYAYGDTIDVHGRMEAQESLSFFDLRALEPLRTMFTHQPIRELASLLRQSDRHPVCFSYLLAGLSGDLDHYNFRAPLRKWREFSIAVKSHFGVRDIIRFPREGANLERVAPEDALQGSDPNKELQEIKKIQWDDVHDRPRITIVDRKSERLIINVKDLQKMALESGYFKSVEVVYLEDMDVEGQVRLMGITDVLFGMDGTGMMNGIFLPEGGVVVHVRPYGCKEYLSGKGVNFDRLWAANPGRVIRYESGDRNSTRFPTNIPEVPNLVFNHSSSVGYRFAFILKQDTFVDPVAFRCILDTSHKLLHGIPVNWPSHLACTRTVFT